MCSPHTSYRWRGERVIKTIKCMRSPHTSYRWRGKRVIEPIKCMRSPHTSYRWRGERDIDNQMYVLTTHQLQVERRESHRDNQVYALTTHQLQVERRESHRVNRVQRTVNTAAKIIGAPLPSILDIFLTRCSSKAKSIVEDPTHPSHSLFQLLPSGRRYRSIRARSARLLNSFFPQAVRALNSHHTAPL